MNIFKELALSIYNFKSYSKFLDNKKLKVFAFGILLTLIYFTFSILAPFAKFVAVDGGVGGLVEEYVPDFELDDDSLWVEEIVEYDYNGNYIYIDTDPSYYFYGADEMAEYLYGYSTAILMDSEKIIVKNDGVVDELYYSDLDLDFSKEDLMGFVPYAYVCIIICLIVMYLFTAATFFFGVLFVALIGMIVASYMKCKLTFGQLYLLGIYTRTLPLLIKLVLSLFSASLPLLINFGISVAILALAIRNMKNEEPEEIPVIEFTSEENL